MEKTSTQYRGICPSCFGQWAIVNGGMSQHGYNRRHGWNAGACYGRGAAHFGTEAGRDHAAETASKLVQWAAGRRDRAALTRAGELPVVDRKGRGVENPMPWRREEAAAAMEHAASLADRDAAEIRARVAAWQPAAPVEVTVASESMPRPVHLRARVYGHTGKLCAASAMGTMSGNPVLTEDETAVTCSRCMARIARRKERAAAKASA